MKDISQKKKDFSYKLKKILSLHSKNVLTTDPYVMNDKDIKPLNYVKNNSDILVIATPHKIYNKIKTNKIIYNIWIDL